jgi:carboxyl-terminal processing protease
MSRFSGPVLRGLALGTVLLCAYGAGVVTGNGTDREPVPPRPGLLDDAAVRINRYAAAPVNRAELERAALDGMLRRLGDRWAHYYTAREYDDAQGRLNGRYSGVGLWLGTSSPDDTGKGAVHVASVQPGSAAEHAGVRVGDVIEAIDGRAVQGWSVTKVAAALRGGPGSAVRLTVRRGATAHEHRLVRRPVHTGDVTVTARPGDVLMIRITAFTRDAGAQVRAALRTPARHAGGVILDLRGNPGGLLEEAVETASAFLAGGLVVTYERRGAPPSPRTVTAPGDSRTPLVVLVDAGTASAAEVVAGSLRDRDRAVLVGSRTYGKGSVQEPVRLADGSAIELTVGRYRTPGGRNLDGVGIEPDVAVSADRPSGEALHRAHAVLRGLLAAVPTKDRG